ncbi:MAG: FKBP-type peptidyl-prolyl cis-trans isomerase [Solirubrobacterales bacterium]|nr:FKBP-type peptidyl-prolyl cis-trans isomerase [Solirubrobacterales bacterium]
MKFKATLLITLLALAAFVVGCGGSGASLSDVNSEAASTAETTSTKDEPTGQSSGGKTVQPKVSGSLDKKPELTDSSGDPPTKLIEKDIKVGTGPAAKSGDAVTVNYVGQNWSNNEEFDTSWGKDPFEFNLGEGGVIKGWDEGVVGMKKGGRRLLIIPPDLGYGAQGQGSIPANETLVFVVDLVKIR